MQRFCGDNPKSTCPTETGISNLCRRPQCISARKRGEDQRSIKPFDDVLVQCVAAQVLVAIYSEPLYGRCVTPAADLWHRLSTGLRERYELFYHTSAVGVTCVRYAPLREKFEMPGSSSSILTCLLITGLWCAVLPLLMRHSCGYDWYHLNNLNELFFVFLC